jgi:hypothetical protein
MEIEGGGSSFNSSVLVDALPYIDSEYDEPGMKEMVSKLVCFIELMSNFQMTDR